MEQSKSDFIKGLRSLADWFEGTDLESTSEFILNIWAWDKEGFTESARKFGSAQKVKDNNFYMLRKDFGGGVKADLNVNHHVVCEKVLVSKEVVPEHIIPAQPETVVPESVVKKYEWRCPESVLKTA